MCPVANRVCGSSVCSGVKMCSLCCNHVVVLQENTCFSSEVSLMEFEGHQLHRAYYCECQDAQTAATS